MSSIDLYLYYGRKPCSDVTYGVTYEGSGKKIEIIQLKKGREINLKKLKKKIMKELDLDRRLHDIKIIYRAPYAVFNDRIGPKSMVCQSTLPSCRLHCTIVCTTMIRLHYPNYTCVDYEGSA